MLAKTKKNRFGNNVSICMHGSFMGRDEPFYLTPGSITLPDCRYCQYHVLRSHWSSLRRRGGPGGAAGPVQDPAAPSHPQQSWPRRPPCGNAVREVMGCRKPQGMPSLPPGNSQHLSRTRGSKKLTLMIYHLSKCRVTTN